MRAAILKGFGSSAKFEIEDLRVPDIKRDEVLVRLHATSVNPVDWQTSTVMSYLPEALRRKPIILGHDLSGEIVDVGYDVVGFEKGDFVFGTNGLAIDAISNADFNTGTYCEYAAVNVNKIARMPKNLDYPSAASIPLVALTAYQGLEKAQIKQDDKLLVIGGSGGVGSMAVQIAKAKGAHVTAVCSTKNLEFVRDLGAEEVIDYTVEDYQHMNADYDIVFNTIGHQTYSTCSNLLSQKGVFIDCAAPQWPGALGLAKRYLSLSRRKNVFFLYRSSKEDLEQIGLLIEKGKLKPVISKKINLNELNQGLSLSKSGRVAGKIAVLI